MRVRKRLGFFFSDRQYLAAKLIEIDETACLNRTDSADGLTQFISKLKKGVIAVDGEWGGWKVLAREAHSGYLLETLNHNHFTPLVTTPHASFHLGKVGPPGHALDVQQHPKRLRRGYDAMSRAPPCDSVYL